MRLTHYSNYALRTLQFAALSFPSRVSVGEIAKRHRISRHHLLKVVHQLGEAGMLDVIRGRAGGITLAQSADKIRVGDVIRITEAPLELAECFNSSTNTCVLIGVCSLSQSIKKALSAFLDVLDNVSIADIAKNGSVLRARLGLDT